MTKRLSTSTSIFLLHMVLTPMASADVVGATDAAILANVVKQLNQLKNQYKLLNDSYTTAKSQLDGINDLKKLNSGSYGFGNLDNGLDNLKSWQSSANNWDDALKNISGGNQTRYAELVKAYEAAHPTVTEAELTKGASPARIAQFKQSRTLNKAASVETTAMFNEINLRLKGINTLSSNIDAPKNENTKSAIDLNSRLVAELAYIQVLNLKLQTLISQQLAQSSANELADDSEMIRFNTLPDE